jgi:hypothetical protein
VAYFYRLERTLLSLLWRFGILTESTSSWCSSLYRTPIRISISPVPSHSFHAFSPSFSLLLCTMNTRAPMEYGYTRAPAHKERLGISARGILSAISLSLPPACRPSFTRPLALYLYLSPLAARQLSRERCCTNAAKDTPPLPPSATCGSRATRDGQRRGARKTGPGDFWQCEWKTPRVLDTRNSDKLVRASALPLPKVALAYHKDSGPAVKSESR